MRKPSSRLNVVSGYRGHAAHPVFTSPTFHTAPTFWQRLAFPAALAGALVVGAAIIILLNL